MTTRLVKPRSSAFAANAGVETRIIAGSYALVAKPTQLIVQKIFTVSTCLREYGYSTLLRMPKNDA